MSRLFLNVSKQRIELVQSFNFCALEEAKFFAQFLHPPTQMRFLHQRPIFQRTYLFQLHGHQIVTFKPRDAQTLQPEIQVVCIKSRMQK